jgi:hypothetical protein
LNQTREFDFPVLAINWSYWSTTKPQAQLGKLSFEKDLQGSLCRAFTCPQSWLDPLPRHGFKVMLIGWDHARGRNEVLT